MSDSKQQEPKDFWDKLQIVLSPVGGLLTALAVASLGFIGSRTVERQQSSEAKLRLYSELMTRREESEATLRKEMFQSIIGSFFDITNAYRFGPPAHDVTIATLSDHATSEPLARAFRACPTSLGILRSIIAATISDPNSDTQSPRSNAAP